MEIMSYIMTMDILSTDEKGKPLFSADDADTPEVLLLNDGPSGLTLAIKRPIRCRSDLKAAELSCLTKCPPPPPAGHKSNVAPRLDLYRTQRIKNLRRIR